MIRNCICLWCFVIMVLTAYSCGDSGALVEKSDGLQGFHLFFKHRPEGSSLAKEAEGSDLYLDFSGSIEHGVNTTYDALESVISTLKHDDSKAFAVYDILRPLDYSEIATEQGGDFYARNTELYRETRSFLHLATEQITLRNREAVFVTDFCREDGHQSSQPNCDGTAQVQVSYNNSDWARGSFQDWLCKGNGITVFSHAFNNPNLPGQASRIYYLFFWLRGDTAHNSNFTRLGEIFDGQEGFDRLDFSRSMLHISPRNADKPEMEKSLGSEIEYITHWEDPQYNFSYYQLDRAALIDALAVEEFEKDKIVLEDLFFSNQAAAAEAPRFLLKAFDITASYASYRASREQAEEEDEAAKAPAPWPASREYSNEWEATDAFLLQNRPIGKEYELRIQLPEPMSLPIGRHLYRLDVVLEENKQQWQTDWDRQLTWQYDSGIRCSRVKSLSSSLKGAVDNCPTEEQIIYTYYLEIAN